MSRKRKHPVIDRTYRTEPGTGSYWTLAQKLLGQKVVVYLPDYPEGRQWKAGYLLGMLPGQDLFMIKWTKRGFGRTLPGIWRVHPRSLFTGTNLLPVPKYPARLPQSTTRSEEDHMATRKPATKKASTTTKKKAPAKSAENNGARKTTGRTRGPDKLEGLTEAKRRNIAKLIYRERSKSPATSWPDITELIENKYDWTLPGSMTGRRLLRDYGPDDAESAIIKQDKSGAKKAVAKKVATKKGASKKKVKEVEEPDDLEELDEDDELEEDLEDEDEEEMEEELDEEDEDDDEDDEDEEDEEPEPAPKSKKVRVTKGRGKKSNPS